MNMKKLFSLLLCLALVLSLGVGAYAASGEASGAMGADQQYGLTNEENSLLAVQSGVVTENPAYGSYELASGGEIGEDVISGVKIIGADDQSNAIYLSETDDAAEFTVGGKEDFYEVEGLGSFNSVIEVRGPETDPERECWYGVGITTLGGVLTVENTYIYTEGYRASAIYTPSGEHETQLVVKDSLLWADGAPGGFIPDFKLLVGSARATLILGEDLWFYNTDIVARDWGAFSHDTNTTDIQLYALNSYGECYQGGYGIYALNGIQNFMYGTELVSPQYGMFVMGAGEAVFDNLAAADEAALLHAGDCDLSEPATEGGRSILAGGCNAAIFHVNGNVMDPGILTIRDAIVTTMPEDIVSRYGNEMYFDLDSYLLSPVKYGESWFYMQQCLGSLFVTRSHGGIINLEEGAELRAANGVIVQTMIAYDDTAGSIFHDSTDTRVLKDVTVNIATDVEGDILHEDYQRNMIVNVADDYKGLVTSGSITAWNNLWAAENLTALLEQGGMEGKFDLNDEVVANIRSCLVREEDTAAYTDVLGVTMNVAAGGVWTVEGESSVLALNVEEGGEVIADEIYVNCAFGADGYLDPATGTALESLAAGSYENVVLLGGAGEQPAMTITIDIQALRDILLG